MNTGTSDILVGIIYAILFAASGPFAFWQQSRGCRGKKMLWPLTGGCLTQLIISAIFIPYAIGAISAVLLHDGITSIKKLFKRTSQTSSSTPNRPPYATTIAGINYRGNLDAYLNKTTHCIIEEDPTNTHDKNAIKVTSADGRHLGFIPASETASVRRHLSNIFPAVAEAIVQKSIDEADGHSFYHADLTIK